MGVELDGDDDDGFHVLQINVRSPSILALFWDD